MKWQNAIRDYQLYLKIERGLSQNTIDAYSTDLEKLSLFLEEKSHYERSNIKMLLEISQV